MLIRVNGVRGLTTRGGLFLALLLTLLDRRGGGEEEATVPQPATPAASSPTATGGESKDGERVAGTFEGNEALDLGPGDQVGLLDSGGAVAETNTV